MIVSFFLLKLFACRIVGKKERKLFFRNGCKGNPVFLFLPYQLRAEKGCHPQRGSEADCEWRPTYVSVFAYEKGEGSARNFSDWLVEESRIEQPDNSCRGESVDVRNGIDPRIKYLIAGGSSIHGRGRLSFKDRSNKRKRTHNYGTR